jgi:hypothetical protein
MPDTQFIAVILLLVAAVVFGYFYFKRAQGRTVETADVDRSVATSTPRTDYAAPAASPAPAATATDDDDVVVVRRDAADG